MSEQITCSACGKPMVHNVPRMGDAGGFVHADTHDPMCEQEIGIYVNPDPDMAVMQAKATPTPRTDAHARNVFVNTGRNYWVYAEFARQLETELSAAQSALQAKDREIERLKANPPREKPCCLCGRTIWLKEAVCSDERGDFHPMCGAIQIQNQLREELAKAKEENAELTRYRDNVLKIKELHATPGAMEMCIEQEPEVSIWVAQCFASIVSKCENYAEMHFEPAVRNGTRITVTVQKHTGKTPHELRRIAEQERDQLKQQVDEWDALKIWGGTPEIINQFIKGQQNRINATQDLEQQIADALAEWKAFYDAALDESHKNEQAAASENDTHGMNFHQGKRSGLISCDIGLDKLKKLFPAKPFDSQPV